MKRLIMMITVGCFISAGALMVEAQDATPPLEATDSTGLPTRLWKRGLEIAPVRLNLDGKNRKLVGEGSYIVNVRSACVDCHTNPAFSAGGNPFRGEPEQVNVERYLAGGVRFGPFTSANLTPDLQTGLPAGLTFEQFVEVMRTGKDFKNRHPQFGPLLQVMPWPAYRKMTDDELRAIYEYLRAIPHAEPAS
jgi:hypothetical protein